MLSQSAHSHIAQCSLNPQTPTLPHPHCTTTVSAALPLPAHPHNWISPGFSDRNSNYADAEFYVARRPLLTAPPWPCDTFLRTSIFLVPSNCRLIVRVASAHSQTYKTAVRILPPCSCCQWRWCVMGSLNKDVYLVLMIPRSSVLLWFFCVHRNGWTVFLCLAELFSSENKFCYNTNINLIIIWKL